MASQAEKVALYASIHRASKAYNGTTIETGTDSYRLAQRVPAQSSTAEPPAVM